MEKIFVTWEKGEGQLITVVTKTAYPSNQYTRADGSVGGGVSGYDYSWTTYQQHDYLVGIVLIEDGTFTEVSLSLLRSAKPSRRSGSGVL